MIPEDVRVRQGGAGDDALLRWAFPKLYHPGKGNAEVLVVAERAPAEDGTPRPHAGFALASVPKNCVPSMVPAHLTVAVDPGMRRKGIGGALLNAVGDAVYELGSQALEPARSVEPKDSGAKFLASSGFLETDRLHHFQAGVADLVAVTPPPGRIPRGGQVVSLREVAKADVGEFLKRQMKLVSPVVADRVRDNINGFSAKASSVAMVGDEIKGVLLVTSQKNHATRDLEVTLAGKYNEWILPLLRSLTLESLLRSGTETLRFSLPSGQAAESSSSPIVEKRGESILFRKSL